MTLLVGPGTVATFGGENEVLADHGVLIEGNEIRAVGPYAALTKEFPKARRLDAGGRLITPGFVNAHMHFYSTLARGIAMKDEPPTNFVEILERLWWRLDKALRVRDCYLSAAVPILEGIRHGVTTYLDHHASPLYHEGVSPEGSLDEVAQAVLDTGVRACLCYEVSDRDGEAIALAGIAENERFLARIASGDDGDGRLAGVMGLHAQFTCSDETLTEARRVAESYGTGVHVHCAEAASDREDAKRRGAAGAVHRLAEAGLLGEKTIVAHVIHTDESEWEILAETKTAATHQPTSNMNNAVGAMDLVGVKGAGVLVGIGTDGMTPNVLEDLRVACWLTRHRAGDPRVGWTEPIEAFVAGNPTIASRYFKKPVGVLKPGAFADVAVMEYWPPTPMDASNFGGHLAFGIASSVARHVVCNGEVILRDGAFTREIDEGALAERAREAAKGVWERF